MQNEYDPNAKSPLQNPHSDEAMPEAPLEEEPLFDEERMQTINARKQRQKSARKTTMQGKITLAAMTCAGVLLVMLLTLGPTRVGALFGIIDPLGFKKSASEFDNIITKEKDDNHGLSLDIPYTPPPEEDRLGEETRAMLAAMREEIERLKNLPASGGLSQREIDALLEKQADQLRKEAEERNRQRRANQRREEEEAKRAAEARKRALEIDARQTTSSGLILDNTSEGQPTPGAEPAGLSSLGAGANQFFLASAARSGFGTAKAEPLGNLSRIVVQGTLISAVLETAINTELPGNIRAQITRPVYSYNGEHVLIPAGTRLIGTFNNSLATAQSRLLIAWNRAITPEGLSINIGSTGVDTLGRSGTAANVNNRYLARFGSALLISVISALPSIAANATEEDKKERRSSSDSDSDLASTFGFESSSETNSNGLREGGLGALENVSSKSQQALNERFNLPPILRVAQGEEIRVFVNKDLVF